MQSAYQLSTIHQILEEKNITDLHFISRLEHYFPKISDLFEKLYKVNGDGIMNDYCCLVENIQIAIY